MVRVDVSGHETPAVFGCNRTADVLLCVCCTFLLECRVVVTSAQTNAAPSAQRALNARCWFRNRFLVDTHLTWRVGATQQASCVWRHAAACLRADIHVLGSVVSVGGTSFMRHARRHAIERLCGTICL